MDTDGIHHGPVTLHNQTMQTEGAVVALTGVPPCVVMQTPTPATTAGRRTRRAAYLVRVPAGALRAVPHPLAGGAVTTQG